MFNNKRQRKENFRTLEQLGSGAYGTVFKAERCSEEPEKDKKYYAWK